MKATELRIGNFTQQGVVVEITRCIKDSFRVWNDGQLKSFRDDEVAPILLTEEWHNKFGVEMKFKHFTYKLPIIKNIEISIIHDLDYVYLRQRNDNHPMNDSIISIWNRDLVKRDMYVHEWQNLYFALTGAELKLKEVENE